MLRSGKCTAERQIKYLEDCKSNENTSSEIYGGNNEPDNTPDYRESEGSLGASECIIPRVGQQPHILAYTAASLLFVYAQGQLR